MNAFKILSKLYFILAVCIFLNAHSAKANTLTQHHNDVVFNCVEESPAEHFCTNITVINPTSILQLSRFERKMISKYVNAFRIMPTINNLTQNTIRAAKIRLTFAEKSQIFQTFIIDQNLIPNSTSHTNLSYLIRSDVPAQASLYQELLSIAENASYDRIILELIEVTYKD